jgi:hypothetical protein
MDSKGTVVEKENAYSGVSNENVCMWCYRLRFERRRAPAPIPRRHCVMAACETNNVNRDSSVLRTVVEQQIPSRDILQQGGELSVKASLECRVSYK